jgi:4-hydroxy-tetrahydrodipicolinate reductase
VAGKRETTGTRVVVAGATGWAGSALSLGIVGAADMNLTGAVSRSHAGERLGEVLGVAELGVEISGTTEDALASKPDVFVEYTHPSVARQNILAALNAGAHVVVGTSGLTSEDYDSIHQAAKKKGLGVLACGNFSITAVLMMRFSEVAAQWVKSWEVIDYAGAGKVDAPSGTARELAGRLAKLGPPEIAVPIGETQGEKEARGANIGGTQVHSIRLPSFVIAVESIFGQEDERLTIRHDAGISAKPYVAGGLLAIRQVSKLVGVHRGLDTVMDLG